jgi:cytochrome b561
MTFRWRAPQSPPSGYHTIQVWLHWIVAGFVVGLFLTHEGIVSYLAVQTSGGEPSAMQRYLTEFHIWGGYTVLVLSIWRVALRVRFGAPPLPEREGPLLSSIARLSHALLYSLLLLVPLSGIPGFYFGMAWATTFNFAAFWSLAAIVALHAGAALWHHFILRTNVLRRMLRPSPPAFMLRPSLPAEGRRLGTGAGRRGR